MAGRTQLDVDPEECLCLLSFTDVSKHIRGLQQGSEFTVVMFWVPVLAEFLHWDVGIRIE